MSAASYGFRTPNGADYINTGDDDITFNAEKAAELFDLMGFRKSNRIPTGTDMDTFNDAGYFYTGDGAQTSTLTNLGIDYPSVVINMPATAYVMAQIQIPYGVNSGFWYRTGNSPTTKTPWVKLGKGWARGELPLGTNVYDMRGPAWEGVWNVSGAATSGTILGTPPTGMGAWLPGQIEIKGSGGGSTNLSTLIYTPYQTPSDPAQMVWTMTIKSFSQTGAAAWSAWTDLAGGRSASELFGAGVPNDMRIQALKDEYPLLSTGNKGVVNFRYDHGLTNLKSTLWPMHQAAGIPFVLAMNSRLWDIAENSGATQADVKAWIATGLVEIANHGTDHKDRNTPQGIFETFVTGREELEAQLSTIVHGLIVPGVTEFDKFGGFGGGSLNSYSSTLAGELILANHALGSGTIGGTHRPLDGIVRQGGGHIGWENRTFAQIKTQIDLAVSTKTALTILCHPRNMNVSGYWTPALAQQVIDYVKARIDAGELANISYYQSHHATL